MKIIYRGGYNKENKKFSTFFEYKDAIKRYLSKGKRVVVVTFAQPDNHYDAVLEFCFDSSLAIIDNSSSKDIDWNSFDLILIPGGTTNILKGALISYGFDINNLKKDVIIIGDSAGAYVLSKYYFGTTIKADGSKEYYLEEGLHPGSNLFTVAHIDNKYHAPNEKLAEAKKIADKINIELLLLKENEAVLYENGKRQDFHIDNILV